MVGQGAVPPGLGSDSSTAANIANIANLAMRLGVTQVSVDILRQKEICVLFPIYQFN